MDFSVSQIKVKKQDETTNERADAAKQTQAGGNATQCKNGMCLLTWKPRKR